MTVEMVLVGIAVWVLVLAVGGYICDELDSAEHRDARRRNHVRRPR